MAETPLAGIVAAHLANPPPYPAENFAGRGIVICAGGPRYFTCAYVLLHILRHALACTLPVQIWHLGASELSPAMRNLLAGFGAEIIDAASLLERFPARINNGWALKPYAILHSRFAEVLSLDADAIPLAAPDAVFDWPEYTQSGALFWPDIVDIAAENPVWATLGLPPRREIAFEAGQLCVDKRRCWQSLSLTVALNNESEALYKMIYGEKDSFLLAFLLTGRPFHRHKHRPLSFEGDLIQLDREGQPFIHHRTLSKFLRAGPNRPIYGGELDAAMNTALAGLRANWTGIVFHPPAMSPAAAAMAQNLAGQIFTYRTSGGTRAMQLQADFQIGTGRDSFEQHWAIIEREDGLVVQFFSATTLSIELHPEPDGSWQGVATVTPPFTAALIPARASALLPQTVLPASFIAAALADAAICAPASDEAIQNLETALALINRTHGDVPESLSAYLETHPAIAPQWRQALPQMADRLRQTRDARLAATQHQKAPMDVLRPGFYDRV